MINRNNYEEYFLLLADKELLPVEEAAVRQFAAKHPDLQEELTILLSCRLNTDSMPVFPKEKLLRNTLWNAENPEPIHTRMLLLLDGELPIAEQAKLQTAIAASTTLQAEWNSLQKTKLVPTVITYPHKEVLLRNSRKVRPLLWMRWAAAAALITGMGWLLWMQQEQKSITPNNTLVAASTNKQVAQSPVHQQSSNPQQIATPNPINLAQTVATTAPITKEVATTSLLVKEQPQNKQPSTVAEEKDNANSNVPAQLTPAEPDLILATLNSTNIPLTAVTASESNPTQVAHLSVKPAALLTLASHKQDAFMGKKEVVTGEEDDFVTVGGARINKQKMRGLFRNVTRSVTRSFSKSKLEPDVYATR